MPFPNLLINPLKWLASLSKTAFLKVSDFPSTPNGSLLSFSRNLLKHSHCWLFIKVFHCWFLWYCVLIFWEFLFLWLLQHPQMQPTWALLPQCVCRHTWAFKPVLTPVCPHTLWLCNLCLHTVSSHLGLQVVCLHTLCSHIAESSEPSHCTATPES